MTNGRLDLWTLPLHAPLNVLNHLEALLSPEETGRAAKFRFDHLRDSFVIAHGSLRLLLAHYTGLPASQIRLRAGARGKPHLDPPQQELCFNLSHSRNFALIGVTRDCEIGVDIESHRQMPDLFQIARRFFCPEEVAELEALPNGQQVEAFFLCWTRKEAYIKAIGEGLHAPLNQFQVTLQPGSAARFVHIDHDPAGAARWCLHDLPAPAGHAAAAAYQGTPRQLFTHQVTAVQELLDLF